MITPFLKANPDYKRLKQVPNLIISLNTEVSTPLQLSNTTQNPITDLIGYWLGEYTCILLAWKLIDSSYQFNNNTR